MVLKEGRKSEVKVSCKEDNSNQNKVVYLCFPRVPCVYMCIFLAMYRFAGGCYIARPASEMELSISLPVF